MIGSTDQPEFIPSDDFLASLKRSAEQIVSNDTKITLSELVDLCRNSVTKPLKSAVAGRDRDFNVLVGGGLFAMSQSALFSGFPYGRIAGIYNGLHILKQIDVFFDSKKVPKGVLGWAWVSEYSVNALRLDPSAALHLSELNEGVHLFLRIIVRSQESDIWLKGRLKQLINLSDGKFSCIAMNKVKRTLSFTTIDSKFSNEFVDWLVRA
jgi:hypothetical protein